MADSSSIEQQTVTWFLESGSTLATAESCTGGLIAHLLTNVSGASGFFVGGVVAYSNRVKETILGVPPDVLAANGAVSAETATAMAEGVRRRLGADYGLAVTGIAGPGGGTTEKPVGLVYIGSVVKGVTLVEQIRLPGQRDQVRERAAYAALDLLRRRLRREVPAR